MAEVLAPRRRNITQNFAQGFEGMTVEPVPLVELEAAREALIASITGGMPDAHRRFLMGFERGEPDWELIRLPEAADRVGIGLHQGQDFGRPLPCHS